MKIFLISLVVVVVFSAITTISGILAISWILGPPPPWNKWPIIFVPLTLFFGGFATWKYFTDWRYEL